MWNSVPTNFWNDPEKILTPGFSLRGKKRLEKAHVMVRYPEGTQMLMETAAQLGCSLKAS